MIVAVCGGTGFIGSALADALEARGDEVWIVTRRRPPADKPGSGLAASRRFVAWEEWEAEPGRIAADAIVNLAGESINQRWTAAAKRRIVDSRVQAAGRIERLLPRMAQPPSVVVNASGISLYGHSGDDIFDENSPVRPADFLGETVVQWEAAADRIPANRLVKLRIGLVLADRGGAFPMLRLPYRLFVGGRMGDGRQGLPWIHLRDMVGLILLAIDNPAAEGPMNAVAPDPVTNDGFGRALARASGRPHWFHAPAAFVRLGLGEMSTLVLTGQKAMPRKALELGYAFAYPRLDDALRDLT